MWWVFGGIGLLLYFTLFIWLGVSCIRNGHLFMFILGFFFPLLWIIGAVMSPPRAQPA